jgi:hypothetical protein
MYEIDPSQKKIRVSRVKGRLVMADTNESDSTGSFRKPGIGKGFQYVLMLPSGTDIKQGDYVINNANVNKQYIVDFVDYEPGGLLSSHYEAMLTTSGFVVNS